MRERGEIKVDLTQEINLGEASKSFQLLTNAALQFKNDKRTKHESLIQQIAVKNKNENESLKLGVSLINNVVKALGFLYKPVKTLAFPISLISKGITWAIDNSNSEDPEKVIIRIAKEE